MAKVEKAAPPAKAEKPAKEPKVKAEPGAPRPRKFEYGIIDEARVVRVAGEHKVSKKLEPVYELTKGDPTVAKFAEKCGADVDFRHYLRVMMRSGFIQLKHKDGATFPTAAVPKPPKEEKKEEKKEEVKK